MNIKDSLKNFFYKQYIDYFIEKNRIKELGEFKRKIQLAEANLHKNYECRIEIMEERNNEEPLVSIITPTYNSASFLDELRNSLENQDIANKLQWIIVDDASTDNTKEIFHKMAKNTKLNSYKFIALNKNLGTSNALNIAANNSNASILGWVSADDAYIDSNKLSTDLNMIRDGYDCIFSRYLVTGSDIISSKSIDVLFNNERAESKNSNFYFLYRDLIVGNIFNGSSSIFKKDLFFRCGGFDTNLGIFDQDGDLWGKFLLSNAKIGLSETSSFYRIHKNQNSNRRYEMLIFSAIVRIRLINYILSHADYEYIDYFDKRIYHAFSELFHYVLSNAYFIKNSNMLKERSKFSYFAKKIENGFIDIERFALIERIAEEYDYTNSFKIFKEKHNNKS